MKIQLRIDHLSVEGFDLTARERHRLSLVVELELARLLTQQGPGPHSLSHAAVDRIGNLPRFGPDATGSDLGLHIARSIHGGLAK